MTDLPGTTALRSDLWMADDDSSMPRVLARCRSAAESALGWGATRDSATTSAPPADLVLVDIGKSDVAGQRAAASPTLQEG
jgi:hypothetical protein